MTKTLIRGRTLTFLAQPQAPDDMASCHYEEDGALLVENGKIVRAGPCEAIREDTVRLRYAPA